MMILLYVFLVIAFVFIILILVAPKQFDVSRSITINKPISEVFAYLKFVKNQDYWSPWKKKDPTMKQEFFGVDGEVGFVAKWEGNKDVGSGEQEIVGVVENDILKTKLRLFKPWKSESDAYLKVEALGLNKTNVVWGFSGESKPPSNVFFMFFNMNKAAGKDFEEGLASLKIILEK
ncbi:SRPBCC family protein [Tamlana flava]|uniref:SRPBCC family protein n=1 Tax=Tamlana flava TaxID=3158572 RepID=UPI00351BD1C6